MSKYTTEVRYICEMEAGLVESEGFSSIQEIIDVARPKIFNFSYPIFDEAYRPVLESKILKHYYIREIAHETVGLWKHRLDVKLNEIMPYYNQLYKSELLEFNPLYDFDVERKHTTTEIGKEQSDENISATRTGNVSSTNNDTISENTIDNRTQIVDETTGQTINNENDVTSNVDNTSNTTQNTTGNSEQAKETKDDISKLSKNKYSDTPQGSISDLEEDKYLTNARIIENTDSLESNETITGENTEAIIGETIGSTIGVSNEKGKSISSGTSNSVLDDNKQTNKTGNKSNVFSETSSGGSNVSNTGVKDITNTVDYLETVKGKQSGVSYSKMLMEYRDTFLNIDKMVLDELADLFFNLW